MGYKYYSEDIVEQMWHEILEWRNAGWITEEEADKIRDIIGA